MTYRKTFYFGLLFLSACANNKSHNAGSDSTIMIIDSQKISSLINADSSKSAPYDSSLNAVLNLDIGYIDIFSVNGHRFRLLADSDNYSLEKYQNGKWITNLSKLKLNSKYGYDRTQDINGDGFTDFLYYGNDEKPGFLYDSKKNEFIPNSIEFPNEWTIIDSSKKILCGIYYYDKKDLSGVSELYTFDGSKIYTFARLENIPDKEFNVKKIILYKCVDGNASKKIKAKESLINANDFDYTEFWKTNYKSFINYR